MKRSDKNRANKPPPPPLERDEADKALKAIVRLDPEYEPDIRMRTVPERNVSQEKEIYDYNTGAILARASKYRTHGARHKHMWKVRGVRFCTHLPKRGWDRETDRPKLKFVVAKQNRLKFAQIITLVRNWFNEIVRPSLSVQQTGYHGVNFSVDGKPVKLTPGEDFSVTVSHEAVEVKPPKYSPELCDPSPMPQVVAVIDDV